MAKKLKKLGMALAGSSEFVSRSGVSGNIRPHVDTVMQCVHAGPLAVPHEQERSAVVGSPVHVWGGKRGALST